MRFVVALGCAAVLTALSASTGAAQSAASVEVGALSGFGESILQAGARFSTLRPRAVAVDVGVHTLPEAVAEGFFIGLIDVGLGYGIPLSSDAWLLPRAGGALLVGLGGGETGAAAGFGAAVGLIVRVTPGFGGRFDMQYRRLTESDVAVGFTSVTMGVTWFF